MWYPCSMCLQDQKLLSPTAENDRKLVQHSFVVLCVLLMSTLFSMVSSYNITMMCKAVCRYTAASNSVRFEIISYSLELISLYARQVMTPCLLSAICAQSVFVFCLRVDVLSLGTTQMVYTTLTSLSNPDQIEQHNGQQRSWTESIQSHVSVLHQALQRSECGHNQMGRGVHWWPKLWTWVKQ